MKSTTVFGPSSRLPHALKELSTRILPRLRLIPEFRCWLPQSPTLRSTLSYPYSSAIDLYSICSFGIFPNVGSHVGSLEEPTIVLYRVFVQGAPLLILLNLLGSKTGGTSHLYAEDADLHGEDSNRGQITEFLRRIEMLELQGVLGYGESFKVAELLSGECSGFIKVLRTVQRVLFCLEATYPNVYELPLSSQCDKAEFTEILIDSEVGYLADIREMEVLINEISGTPPREYSSSLECLSVYLGNIASYQEYIVNYLRRENIPSTDYIFWDELFALKTDLYIISAGAYQSYCAHYSALVILIEQVILTSRQDKELLVKYTNLKELLPGPIEHIFNYIHVCSLVLSYTHPQEKAPIFDSLCLAYLMLSSLRENLNEMLICRRSMRALNILANTFSQFDFHAGDMGSLISEDSLGLVVTDGADGSIETPIFSFLFEEMLLLVRISNQDNPTTSTLDDNEHPWAPWDIGSGLRSIATGLNNIEELCYIRLSRLVSIEKVSDDPLELTIDWARDDAGYDSVVLIFKSSIQLNYWFTLLSYHVPKDNVALDPGLSYTNSNTESETSVGGSTQLSWQDEISMSTQRASSRAKPWSVIARIGEGKDTPDPSVFRFFNSSEHSLISPRLISASPRSISPFRHFHTFVDFETISIAQSSELDYEDDNKEHQDQCNFNNTLKTAGDGVYLLDLTGQIRRTSEYPTAQGGFSDVWTCEWIDERRQRHKVAVKVIRGRLLDMEREEKLGRLLRRELHIWKRLKHRNVVPLYGTCSDFGRYTSLVCPWYDNGSLYQYIRRRHAPNEGLSESERLKILSEIACGLAYLHENLVIHGDLSSANVLINDDYEACIADFGLSTITEDLRDVSDSLGGAYPSSILGGAVRWAAPELFSIEVIDTDCNKGGPQLTMSSDVYSWGSIALEVLTGRVPYEHLKNDGQVLVALSRRLKPPRLPSLFLTDALWALINSCWCDDPSQRPPASIVEKEIRDIAGF